jgi:hypothetical protein
VAADLAWIDDSVELELDRAGRRLLVERAVRPVLGVVRHVDAEHPLEMSMTEDQQPIQACAPKGSEPSLDHGNRSRRPDRGADDPHPLGPEVLVEAGRELRVPVMNQEAHRRSAVRARDGLRREPTGAQQSGGGELLIAPNEPAFLPAHAIWRP